MLVRGVRAECMKLRRSMIWPVVAVLPVISVGMGAFNYSANAGILTKEWYSLWSQVCLFYNYFFFPSLIGVLGSYLWRLEHLGRNWNALMAAPVSSKVIFFAKLAALAGLALAVQAMLGALYRLAGFVLRFDAPVPPELPGWLLKGWIAAVVVGAFQLCVSMRIKSFAVPVGIALAGGIAGLVMMAQGMGLLFPFSLINLGMNGVTPEVPLSLGIHTGFYISSAAFLGLFCYAGIQRLARADVGE